MSRKINLEKYEYKHIISAACRVELPDGKIVILPCHRHADIYYILYELGIKYDKSKVECGFLEWNGNFLNRKEAFIRAQECNQMTRAEGPTSYSGNELYSEDLW